MEKKVVKVVVDRNACAGCATCTVIVPQGFELDADNISVPKPGVEMLDDNLLLMAAQSCPQGAISLYDSEGNKII